MSLSRRSARYTSILLTVGFLLFLAVLPQLLTQDEFSFPVFEQTSAPSSVEVSRELARVPGPGRTKLSALAAKYPNGVIVNFWATWCAPCIEELPSLESLYRQLQASQPDIGMVAISVDDEASAIGELFKSLDFRPTFPVLHDPEGKLASGWGTTRFPETYWIASDGRTLHKWVGPQNWLGESVLGTLAGAKTPTSIQ